MNIFGVWFFIFLIFLNCRIINILKFTHLIFYSRNISHRTCPVCRANVQGSDDTWVLTEKPDSTEYDTQVKGYLIGLADTVGNPQ